MLKLELYFLILTCLACDSIIKNVYDILVIHLNTDKRQYYVLKICFWEFLWTSIKKKIIQWISVIRHFGNSP